MKQFLLIVALACCGPHAFAMEVPSAGSQLQQIPAPPVPAGREAPALQIGQPVVDHAAVSAEVAFVVQSLHVVNARAFSEQQLLAVTGFKPGQTTLVGLNQYADAITDYYRNAGYFLAQTVVPAQDVRDGAVTLEVIEGQYGKIELRNTSRLSDAQARWLLSGLEQGEAVTIHPLETRLLLLSDVPGIAVHSTLVPAATAGATDLLVDVTPGRSVTGSVETDNSGSRYTGAERLGGSLAFNNLAGQGDVLSLRALSSFNGLNYGRAGYKLGLGRLEVGAAFTALDYELGKEFAVLKAHGTAQITTAEARYPLLRGRATNLNLLLNFDAKHFKDIFEVTDPADITRKRTHATTLALVGDHHDSIGGGGVTAWSLQWVTGRLLINTPAAAAADAASVRAAGGYDKVQLSLQRLQRISASVSLFASARGQFAGHNLDVSEKLSLGGAQGVRAYADGEAYVDEGYLFSLEARLPFPGVAPLQWTVFAESGSGRLNKDPWSTARNTRTLNGGGLGLRWSTHGFDANASYAHAFGGDAISSADSHDRFWFSASKQF